MTTDQITADDRVRRIAKEIVAREGGYVNDPDDPGGATNFGVTLGTMQRLGLDLDGEGEVAFEGEIVRATPIGEVRGRFAIRDGSIEVEILSRPMLIPEETLRRAITEGLEKALAG